MRVHEARQIASGASGRNGGFALRGAAIPYEQARTQLGAERARALWRLTESALARLEGLAGDAFRRVGSLRLAADRAERDVLAREHAALSADGFAADWLDDVPRAPGVAFCGGILHPHDGALHPARWVRRLAQHASQAGAEIVQGSRVQPADVASRVVVVAVDGTLAEAVPELRGLVQPVRGQMLATELLPERLDERPHYARNGYDYWQQLPDGRLVVGGRRDADLVGEQTSVDETSSVVQERLDELVVTLLGRLPPVTHRWAGVWGETPDRLPLAGLVPGRERLWVAGGYSGHGNVLGVVCGELVARAILGEPPPELSLFDPNRFSG